MTTILDRDGIAARVPHRGANILIDSLELADDEQSSMARVWIGPDDPYGRTIFGRDDGAGGRCWYEPFLGEMLALAGVPLLGSTEGKVSVFSMISRMVFRELVPLAGEVAGEATIKRTRGAFTQFGCRVLVDGRQVAEGEVLSGTASMEEISSGDTQALPAATGETAEPFAWKHPALTFADAVVEADDQQLIVRYEYPGDHPFVPTHFPGAPLMMGVTQWAAIADAAWLLAERQGRDAIIVDGAITRPDGAAVIDVRGLAMERVAGGVPRITATQRVAFRGVVRPGDGLFIAVTAKG